MWGLPNQCKRSADSLNFFGETDADFSLHYRRCSWQSPCLRMSHDTQSCIWWRWPFGLWAHVSSSILRYISLILLSGSCLRYPFSIRKREKSKLPECRTQLTCQWNCPHCHRSDRVFLQWSLDCIHPNTLSWVLIREVICWWCGVGRLTNFLRNSSRLDIEDLLEPRQLERVFGSNQVHSWAMVEERTLSTLYIIIEMDRFESYGCKGYQFLTM